MDQLIPVWILGAPTVLLIVAGLMTTPKSTRDEPSRQIARKPNPVGPRGGI